MYSFCQFYPNPFREVKPFKSDLRTQPATVFSLAFLITAGLWDNY